MGELAKLPNIGSVVEEQLHQAGIFTPEQLRETGAKEAWLKIQAFDPSACIQRLQGLEGAVRGIPKKLLPEDVKEDLREFYRRHKL